MKISLVALTRLRSIYQIMVVLTTTTNISEEINNNRIVLFTLNDSIQDALNDCDNIICSLVDYRYGLKSEKIKEQCSKVIHILKTMKQNLLNIRDILSTNSRLTIHNHDYDLANDLLFSIEKMYRYIKEEAKAYDE